MYALIRRYQEADSTLTLSSLVRSGFRDSDTERASDLLYGTGALVANAIYRRQGIAGLRRVYQLRADGDTLLRELATELGMSTVDNRSLDGWWRAEAARASRSH
jgi:hypothetical protein